jgi:Leucine-rich repeat (LRR) protein
LTKNKISVISDAIGALRNLEELRLDYNLIDVLPASIGSLREYSIVQTSTFRTTEMALFE